jgi:hypothetical protein
MVSPIRREDLIELQKVLNAERQKYYIKYNRAGDLQSLMTKEEKIRWLELEIDLENLKSQIRTIDFNILNLNLEIKRLGFTY